jgi:hypothetical protein
MACEFFDHPLAIQFWRVARQLARVAGKLKALDDERRRIIGVYAAEQMSAEEYIVANRALDRDLERHTRAKTGLAAEAALRRSAL